MERIDLNQLKKLKDYRIYTGNNYDIVFTTAENSRSFNRWTTDGYENLQSIKKDFKVNEVVYIKQIHSDVVHWYKGDIKDFINNEGDAIITNDKSIATGVFTADCVPIIIVIEEIGIVAAIHSGWKGTYNSIVIKTLEEIYNKEKFEVSKIKVFIGPHIRQCCYEISQELKTKFLNKKDQIKNLFSERNLSLEEYILDDLKECGVKDENIVIIENCTHCCTSTKLHSYRKVNGEYGRLFSFVIKK